MEDGRTRAPRATYRSGLFGFAIAAFAIHSLLGETGASRTPEVTPAPGVFLVAKPSIEGGPFFESVVLLLSHDDRGSLGLIVNRVSEVPLDEAIPDLKTKARELNLQFGGPVGLDGLLFLFRSDDEPDGVAHVMSNVYFSGDRGVLESVLRERRANSLRVFLGHSGWAPGQLEAEIVRGDWELVRAAPGDVFTDEPETLWPRLTKAGRVTAAALMPQFMAPVTAR